MMHPSRQMNGTCPLFTLVPCSQMAKFKGTNSIEFLDNQQIKGNIFEQLDGAMAFCFKHLNLSGKVVGLKREEELEIPYEALREGVINALSSPV